MKFLKQLFCKHDYRKHDLKHAPHSIYVCQKCQKFYVEV